MKIVKLLLILVLAGCSQGEGVYVGTLVDVGWEGFVFKSCEVHFQHGAQSSTLSPASSRDEATCQELETLAGKKLKVGYKTIVPSPLTNSYYQITTIELAQ